MDEELNGLGWVVENLNFLLMITFVAMYSGLSMFNSSQSSVARFSRNVVYMLSGMLFVYYVFQISYLEEFREFEYLAAFVIALSFRDVLPVLVSTVTDIATVKLKQLDTRIKKGG